MTDNNEKLSIIDTTIENITNFGVCGYKSLKKEGFPEKLKWLKKQFATEGLVIKTLYSEKNGAQGMIEYLPGENCWRPVDAKGYIFIHCLFVGFKKIYKNKGYASQMIDECEKDTKKLGLNGIAITVRKGSFMANKDIFMKRGFEVVDSIKPDFQLLVKKYNPNYPSPKFIDNRNNNELMKKYSKGLTIIRADQCPYTVKNVREIVEAAKNDFGVKAKVVTLKNSKEAQNNNPSPFGTFCMIYEGKIVAEHPISKGRFVNIMNKVK